MEIAIVFRLVVPLGGSMGERIEIGGACLYTHILIGIDLREATKGVGLLGAVVEVEREHLGVHPCVYILVIHSAVSG